MINGFYFQKMHTNERGTFTTEVISMVTPFASTNPTLKNQLSQVVAQSSIYAGALSKLSFVDLSGKITATDAELDNEIVNLRDYAVVCASRSNADFAEAGSTIVNTYRKVGWEMHRESFADETQRVTTLLSLLDTDPELVKAVATLNAQSWIEPIRHKHQQLVELLAIRRDKQAVEATKGNTAKASADLGKAIDKLFRLIENEIEFYDRTELLPLVSQLNSNTARYTTLIAQRSSRNSKGNDSTENES